MKIKGFLTGTEWGLLALTALFLGLMVFIFYEGQRAEVSGYVITTEKGEAALPVSSDTDPGTDPNGVFPVNINTATPEELQALTGVGPVLAERIVAYRAEHGPFAAPEDLRAVSGIGESTLEGFRGEITFGEEAGS